MLSDSPREESLSVRQRHWLAWAETIRETQVAIALLRDEVEQPVYSTACNGILDHLLEAQTMCRTMAKETNHG